jgi:ribosomal protein S18 acetylase RimI-like enzyme
MNTATELRLEHHAAEAVPAMRDELIAVHIDARAELLDQPFYSAERFWERFENYLRGPGFDLVTGRLDSQLVGYAFGSTLPAGSQWWQDVEGLGPDFTTETGTRTFAFREILVRKAFQHRGYAHQLHDELLAHRPEERATLLVRSDNPARLLYRRWGWTQIGFAQPFPDSPRFESMVLELKERAMDGEFDL